MLAIKQGGVADGSDKNAATLVGDLGAEWIAFVTFDPEKAQLYQFVGAQAMLQLGEEGRRESAFS